MSFSRFDEVYNIRDINLILHRQFHFDIQPPFGKLLIAFVVSPFWHLSVNDCNLVTIGQTYSPDLPIFTARLLPAIFGSLLAVLSYYTMRDFAVRRPFAATSGFLIATDPALILSSRVVQFDSLVSLSCVANCLFCYRLLMRSGADTFKNAVFFGITTFLAVSSKYIGVYTVGGSLCLLLKNYISSRSMPKEDQVEVIFF
ncbi:unnamed protein product [Didymodactylos carnosus]|uniref:ArnT-like N-terminal domain-containing protein n=1 Tax=Didymodactylos carnosus TaxID=1234261 RepID=A0A815FZK2_9BILA|nr:unnamed protein product [Didymodactylos carnosus]CAF4186562.1 unnamed protein product [Didymodactylos carnosus]